MDKEAKSPLGALTAFGKALPRDTKANLTKGVMRRAYLNGKRLSAPPEAFRRGFKHKDKAELQGAWNAYRRQSMEGGGPDSLLTYPAQLIAEKAMGKHKVRNALWHGVGKPALLADTALGSVLERFPVVGKKLFRTKEQIPWAKGMHKTVDRSSALAPLTKLRDFGEPIMIGMGLEKALQKTHGPKDEPMAKTASADDKILREKVASTMLHLHRENKEHEKRAHALRLLYKQAELGVGCVPQNYSELEEKLASLINQDLGVLEKALELTGGGLRMGELGALRDPVGHSAQDQFQADILGGENF